MSNAYGVNGTAPVSYSTGLDAGMSSVSPDSLLAYCQIQLGDLDSQINDQMTMQKTALREREAVESAQSVLGQFGTTGPTDDPGMQKCVTALDNAIAQLPPNDPVAAQVADFRDKMIAQYHVPGRNLTDRENQMYRTALSTVTTTSENISTAASGYISPVDRAAAQSTVDSLTKAQNGSFRAPDAGAKEWQGTTDALATVANDVKSGAEIQMLHLQDLVSQRQQAIQLCSGIMSKTDQTLEDQAKAIGR